MGPTVILNIHDKDRFVFAVEDDKGDIEVDGVATIVYWMTLQSNVEGKVTSEAIVQHFVVGSIITVFECLALGAALLEDGEESSRPSIVG